MNPEIKAAWIANLKGEGKKKYKQTTAILRDQADGFCCLGVLCDMARVAGVGKWNKDDEGDWNFLGDKVELPPKVQDWAGLTESNPEVERFTEDTDYDHPIDTDLASLNDSGMPFSKIAEYIEARL